MMAAMIHRGPDEEAFFIAPPVAAGMRRLSIIDLPGGSQPVWNETGTLAVLFNGEIYNFAALRKELEALGHQLPHAFRHRDDRARLRGLGRALRRAVARDVRLRDCRNARRPRRAAPRACFWRATGWASSRSITRASMERCFSHPKCARCSRAAAFRRSSRREAVSAYLLFGSVSEPLTLIEGVSSLPPGHTLIVEATARRLPKPAPKAILGFRRRPQRRARRKYGLERATASPAQRVRALLEDAVASHLIADVPVGVFLSSGLDSTAIAALASRSQRGIHTFTVAFPDVEFSEAEKARRTAERLGTEHSELTLSEHEMLARLDEAVAAFDQPSMDGINTYFVSWAARQAGLKVALSGLGSDELFGGYTSFHATSMAARMAALGGWVPKPLRALVRLPRSPPPEAPLLRPMRCERLAPRFSIRALPHPIFFHAAALHAANRRIRLCEGTDHRARAISVAAMAGRRRGGSANRRRVHGRFLARAALLPRQHLTARYGRDEHAAFARGARAVPAFAARRIHAFASGIGEARRLAPEIASRRGAGRPTARRDRGAEKAYVHVSLGELAARVARQAGRGRASRIGLPRSSRILAETLRVRYGRILRGVARPGLALGAFTS